MLDDLSDNELVWHAFHQGGAYKGPSISMYDQHAQGIRHGDQLERVFREDEDSHTILIVPADVHDAPVLVDGENTL